MATPTLLDLVQDDLFGPSSQKLSSLASFFGRQHLSVVPATILVAATPFFYWYYQSKTICVIPGGLILCKQICAIALLLVNVHHMGLWQQSSEPGAQEEINAAAMSSLAALCLMMILHYSHIYAFRSSSLVAICLAAAIACDTMQSQEPLQRPRCPSSVALMQYSVYIKAMLIGLEEIPKFSYKQNKRNKRIRQWVNWEVTTGFFTRCILWRCSSTSMPNSATANNQTPEVAPDISVEILSEQFSRDWRRARYDKAKPSFAWIFFRSNMFPFFFTALPRLLHELLLIGHPFLISSIVTINTGLEKSNEGNPKQGSTVIIAAVLIHGGGALVQMLRKHVERNFTLRVRGILASEVQKKTLSLPRESASSSTIESILDEYIQDITDKLHCIHGAWFCPLMAVIHLYLLSFLVGRVAILAVPSTIMPTLVSLVAAKQRAPVSSAWQASVAARNHRLSKVSSMLAQLKAIRITGLDNIVLSHVYKLYDIEITCLKRSTFWDAISVFAACIFSVSTGPLLITTSMIWLSSSTGFSTHHVIASLSIIVLLQDQITGTVMVYSRLMSIIMHLGKIESYLLQPEIQDQRHGLESTANVKGTTRAALRRKRRPDNYPINVRNAYLASPNKHQSILKALNVRVRIGEMLAVVGPTGCGKSLFMRTLIGECNLKSGSFYVTPGPIAYCDQTPWLSNMSIRENIIGKSEFNAGWYMEVLEACALSEDIRRLPGGDNYVVGSDGAKLSGGQKQRVSLARAVYARHDILVLDDVFAALDRETALAIFTNLFGQDGLLVSSSTTTVLVTHSVELLEQANRYLIIQADGTSNEQTDFTNPLFQRWLAGLQTQLDDTGFSATETTSTNTVEHITVLNGVKPSGRANTKSNHRSSSMLFYLKQFPPLLLLLELTLTPIASVIEYFSPTYAYMWPDGIVHGGWIRVGYLLLGPLCASLAAFCICLWHLKLAPHSSSSLHRQALETIMNCTLSYLTKMNKAEIMHLFSQEITASLSSTLESTFLATIYQTCNFMACIGLAAFPFGYSLVSIPVSIGLTYLARLYYSRIFFQIQNMRLESSKALSVQHSEMVTGLRYIRSFGWEKIYMSEATARLNTSQLYVYHQQGTEMWLLFIADTVLGLSAIAMILQTVYFGGLGSHVSLSLVYLLYLKAIPVSMTRLWSQTELLLGKMARTQTFIESSPTEKDPPANKARLPDEKKQVGEIVLEKVVSRYDSKEGSLPVVDDVSISIPGGWKVGIIGRTGSGKSSFLLTLLKFLEYSGEITIDNVKLSDIPRRELRDRIITSVSQDTIDFEGSVRYNLCPWTMHESKDSGNAHPIAVKSVLDSLGIWRIVEENGGLDAQMSELKLSHGEKHLMCIARACLHKLATGSRIVVMDEASSNLDPDIEKTAHKVMRTCFEDCTVLSVVHRQQTLQECNMIFKFKDGKMSVRTQEPVILDDDDDEENDNENENESSDDGWYADSDDEIQGPAEIEAELAPILTRTTPAEPTERWEPGMPIPEELQRILELPEKVDRKYFEAQQRQMR